MERKRTIEGIGVLVLVTFFWGSTFTCLKFLFEEWSLFFVLGVRFTLAGLILLPFCLKDLARDWRSALKYGGAVAGFNAAAIIFQTMGLWSTTASNASFITAFFVVVVPFGEGVVFRRSVSWLEYVLALTALAGVGFISFQNGFAVGINRGDLFVLICAVFYSAQIIAIDRAVKRLSPALTVCLMFLGTGVVCLGIAFPLETIKYSFSGKSMFWFTFLLLGGTVVAYGFQAWGQRRISSAKAALIYTLEPVFATLFAIVFLPGEGLNLVGIGGAGLIMTALVYSAVNDVMRQKKNGRKDSQ